MSYWKNLQIQFNIITAELIEPYGKILYRFLKLILSTRLGENIILSIWYLSILRQDIWLQVHKLKIENIIGENKLYNLISLFLNIMMTHLLWQQCFSLSPRFSICFNLSEQTWIYDNALYKQQTCSGRAGRGF